MVYKIYRYTTRKITSKLLNALKITLLFWKGEFIFAIKLKRKVYDDAIIGGGIVGLASAYKIQLRNPNLTVAVFEKEKEV